MNLSKAGRQESAAIAVITVGFLLLELGSHQSVGAPASIEPWWLVITLVGVVLYILLRMFKRFSRPTPEPQNTYVEMSLVGTAPQIVITSLQTVLDRIESPVAVSAI